MEIVMKAYRYDLDIIYIWTSLNQETNFVIHMYNFENFKSLIRLKYTYNIYFLSDKIIFTTCVFHKNFQDKFYRFNFMNI